MNQENAVFTTTTSLLTHAKKTLYNLRDKRVLPFDRDKVTKITLKNPNGTFEIVKEGDTLAGIAQKFDVAVDDIMRANGITDPNLIYEGQELIIPTLPE